MFKLRTFLVLLKVTTCCEITSELTGDAIVHEIVDVRGKF